MLFMCIIQLEYEWDVLNCHEYTFILNIDICNDLFKSHNNNTQGINTIFRE